MDPKKRKDAPGSNSPEPKKPKLDVEFDAVVSGHGSVLNVLESRVHLEESLSASVESMEPKAEASSVETVQSLEEAVMQVASASAYMQMFKQMKYLFSDSTKHQFDKEAYLDAANKVLKDDDLLATIKRIGKAVKEDHSKQKKKRPVQLAVKTITDSVDAGGPGGHAALIRCFTEMKFVEQLVEAIKLNIAVNSTVSVDKFGPVEAVKPRFRDGPILHRFACVGDSDSLEKALLEPGTDKNEELDKHGRTALHAACIHGKDNCVQVLLKYGYNVNAVEDQGNTPLHYAVYYGYPLCVEYLLQCDNVLLLENDDGFTPKVFAQDAVDRSNQSNMLLDKKWGNLSGAAD